MQLSRSVRASQSVIVVAGMCISLWSHISIFPVCSSTWTSSPLLTSSMISNSWHRGKVHWAKLVSVAFDLLFSLSAQWLLPSVGAKVIINSQSCGLCSISLSKYRVSFQLNSLWVVYKQQALCCKMASHPYFPLACWALSALTQLWQMQPGKVFLCLTA